MVFSPTPNAAKILLRLAPGAGAEPDPPASKTPIQPLSAKSLGGTPSSPPARLTYSRKAAALANSNASEAGGVSSDKERGHDNYLRSKSEQ